MSELVRRKKNHSSALLFKILISKYTMVTDVFLARDGHMVGEQGSVYQSGKVGLLNFFFYIFLIFPDTIKYAIEKKKIGNIQFIFITLLKSGIVIYLLSGVIQYVNLIEVECLCKFLVSICFCLSII